MYECIDHGLECASISGKSTEVSEDDENCLALDQAMFSGGLSLHVLSLILSFTVTVVG